MGSSPHPPPSPPLRLRRAHPVLTACALATLDFCAVLSTAAVFPDQLGHLAATATLVTVLLALAGLDRSRLALSTLDDVPVLSGRLLLAVGFVGAAVNVLGEPADVRPYLVAGVAALVPLHAARALGYAVLRRLRSSGITSRHTVVLGGGEVAEEVAAMIRSHPAYGLRVIGHLEDGPELFRETSLGPRLGGTGDIASVLRTTDVQVIVVAFGATPDRAVVDSFRSREGQQRDVFIVPRLFEVLGARGITDHMGPIPLVRLQRHRHRGLRAAVKRMEDVVLSALGIVVLSPVLLACAVAVRMTGPQVLFKQQRIGRDGRPFNMLKFRTLRPSSAVESEQMWSHAMDQRVTKVGRFLRSASLDELPQLFNVLRGQMTIVGPRPERSFFVERWSKQIPHYGYRHRAPMGLTGLAQVSGFRGGDESSLGSRARFDNYYIENWSLWLDIKVMIRTFGKLVYTRGS
ncbi:sugar transferase [Motilibacter aurantiacus]|uniref:sugar transferase n=1 Tax=Motilibacter aurantiacus TaxID=2714955 RepID=UPI002F2B835B|nr:sugar transferase [Motilibacter aurantiacus]